MPGSNITTDALRMALILDIEGGEEAIAKLQRVSAIADAVNAKTKKQAEDLDLRRLEVQGKYDPEAQRNFEIEKAIRLTNELNLDLKTQDSILNEIEAKYQRIANPPIPVSPPLDAHVKSYLVAQEKADRDFVAQKQRVAKEIERIEEASLTRSQRYVKQLSELRADRDKGLTDQSGFMVRARALKSEYDAEVKAEQDALKAKQDAAAKRAQLDAEKVAKAVKTAEAIKAASNAEFKAQVDSLNAERTAASRKLQADRIARDTALQKENNKVRQEAINLMRAYETTTQRAASDIAMLDAALTRGTITAAEHAQAIENVNTRMRMMQGGAGRLGFMVGNLGTGLEDFVTVLSITGFGMEGFSAATRAASNNVGQAVRALGTGTAAMLAPIVSIGAIALGFAIPAIYRWATGAEDAAKATDKFTEALERMERIMSKVSVDKLAQLELGFKVEDLKDIKTTEELDKKEKEVERSIKEIEAKMKVLQDKMKGASIKAFDEMVGVAVEQEVSAVAKKFQQFAEESNIDADIHGYITRKFADIRQQFIDESATIGGEEARQNLENNMKKLSEELGGAFRSLGIVDQTRMQVMLQELNASLLGAAKTFNTNLPDFLNDTQLVDAIQNMKDQLDDLNAANREEHVERKAELEEQIKLLEEIQKHREAVAEAEAEVRAQNAHLDQRAMEEQLEMMKIQSQRNRLLGEENEAERKILDLAIRRREIMESGVAAPDVLAGMFDAELKALETDIETQLAKKNEIKAQNDVSSQVEAYTKANAMALEARFKPEDTHQKEMVELLKAIKDHLSGKQLMNVEIQ